jgi:hypothetical protein
MRPTLVCALSLSWLWLLPVHAQGSGSGDELERARCAAVRVLKPAKFAGRTLIEIPDVTAADMRLANMLLSSGCFDEAGSLIQQYLRSNGPDAQVSYVAARFVWRTRGRLAAEDFLREPLREFPAFLSLRVLLAGIRIDEGRFAEASEILDAVAPRAPTDLWVYLDRLRIEAVADPTTERARVLIALLNDPQFPPNARLTAGDAGRHMHGGVTSADTEVIFKGMIAAEANAEGCTVTEYATWLIELEDRVDDARALLEKYVAGHERCPRREHARVLLAYTYLIAAADIAPTVTAANAAWLQRADALLGADYSALADWLRNVPRGAQLWPLVADRLPPDTTDHAGRTQLCSAVMALNIDVVRSELERGADPDEDCDGNAPTWVVLTMKTREHVYERQGILRLLLEHGAKREVKPCQRWFSEDCQAVFGPTLAEFVH